MSVIYPILFIAVTISTWGAWLVQSHRLFYRFRKRYPEVAKREIPFAFEFKQHPEKVLYFLRRKSVDILRADEGLWRLRNQVVVLSVLALLVPFLGIFAIFLAVSWLPQ